uniref:Activator of basal transcription 1 n=1 Tax=Pavo cristatus TaxID=9049 RepID=A0A8C9G064_PAVCR
AEEASAALEASELEVEDEQPEAEAEERQQKKLPVPGVVYLSHVPPGFGPRQLRTLLGGHGELGGAVRRRGRKGAGRYAEGWVEFRDKRAARRAASHLQGAPISNRPRSRFRYDRWCLKVRPEGRVTWKGDPQKDPQTDQHPTWGFTQRPTEPEIWGRKKQPPRAPTRLVAEVMGLIGRCCHYNQGVGTTGRPIGGAPPPPPNTAAAHWSAPRPNHRSPPRPNMAASRPHLTWRSELRRPPLISSPAPLRVAKR